MLFAAGRVADFNEAVKDYLGTLEPQFGHLLQKGGREQFFNRLSPFYQCDGDLRGRGGILDFCFGLPRSRESG